MSSRVQAAGVHRGLGSARYSASVDPQSTRNKVTLNFKNGVRRDDAAEAANVYPDPFGPSARRGARPPPGRQPLIVPAWSDDCPPAAG